MVPSCGLPSLLACVEDAWISRLGALAVPEDRLRRFLIAPEIRLGDARFQRPQALAMLRGVKENSVPA